jgi:hypothetical protein
VAVSPSSTAAAGTGGSGAIDASAAAAAADTSSACGGTGSVLGGWGRGLEEITCTLNARRFRGTRLSTPVSACLREGLRETLASKSKETRQEDLKSGTYILERTRAFFIERSDEPCSGVAHFEPCSGAARLRPTVPGAAPLRPAASTTTTLSPVHSGAIPPASATTEAELWPPPATRDT